MKRLVILIGRGGTVFLSLSLALLLVALIPPAPLGGNGSGHYPVVPEGFVTTVERVLTPQQRWEATVTADGTLTIYILEVSSLTIHDWISEHHAGLDDFIQAYPDAIGSQREMREGTIEYIPTNVTYATLVFHNPSSNIIVVDFETSLTRIIAPGAKVLSLAQWTLPIGLVSALPWIVQSWREKTTHQTPK
jgi:hypothetical protein